jgi:cytochrome c biogenesis protein CcdA/thiol-disulfide isomerase/thioredoxin
MLLLIGFGFIAGAGTAVSPCVLPVLPIALSAGASGGRRRPLGIVAGLVASFTFSTVALVYLISALGLPNDLLRRVAIVVLLCFGVALLIPPLAARVEGYLSRLAGGAGGGHIKRGGESFWSGTLVGASLGLVYAPCAGPILAGVITVSASQSFSVGRLLVALAYGLGSALVLYLMMLGGRRVTSRLARRSGALQMSMGAVMVVVAALMIGNYDIKFENTIARDAPAFLVDPTKGLEAQSSVQKQLRKLRGGRTSALGQAAASEQGQAAAARAGARAAGGPSSAQPEPRLPVLGRAPEFVGTQRWFNTPGGRGLTLAGLRGKVVVVDFWTYSCINCIRTLPYLKAWYSTYHPAGLEIVGVHTPEFSFEKDAGNVATAIKDDGLRYPVVQDNEMSTWNAYGNEYWPAEYFIDARGNVRHAHFGEGDYAADERVIRSLLAEAGRQTAGLRASAHGAITGAADTTPESYLGAARAQRFLDGSIHEGARDFGPPRDPGRDELDYSGRWHIGSEDAIAEGGELSVGFNARRVYLVMGGGGARRSVRVLLDGSPLAASAAGSDVRRGSVSVSSERLYALVNLPNVQHHTLTLKPEAGTRLFAFTFG